MIQFQNNACKTYYNHVKRLLPPAYSDKANALKGLENSLNLYERDHLELTYDSLVADFGTPEKFADSVFDSEESDKIRKNLFFSKKVTSLAVGIALFVIMLFYIAIKIMGGLATQGYSEIEEEPGTFIEENEEILPEK